MQQNKGDIGIMEGIKEVFLTNMQLVKEGKLVCKQKKCRFYNDCDNYNCSYLVDMNGGKRMMEQLHLVEVAEQKSIITRSKYQKWKFENKYKKAEKNSSVRCKNCKHLFANMPNHTGGGKYYKCELLGRSSSSATDIRLSNVCNRFEEYMEK